MSKLEVRVKTQKSMQKLLKPNTPKETEMADFPSKLATTT